MNSNEPIVSACALSVFLAGCCTDNREPHSMPSPWFDYSTLKESESMRYVALDLRRDAPEGVRFTPGETRTIDPPPGGAPVIDEPAINGYLLVYVICEEGPERVLPLLSADGGAVGIASTELLPSEYAFTIEHYSMWMLATGADTAEVGRNWEGTSESMYRHQFRFVVPTAGTKPVQLRVRLLQRTGNGWREASALER